MVNGLSMTVAGCIFVAQSLWNNISHVKTLVIVPCHVVCTNTKTTVFFFYTNMIATKLLTSSLTIHVADQLFLTLTARAYLHYTENYILWLL